MPRRVRSGPVKQVREGHDCYEQVRDIVTRRLAAAPRTRAELAVDLIERGAPSPVIDAVLDRFEELGLVDDLAFARTFVEVGHRVRGHARRLMRRDLIRRGVAEDLVEEALLTIDDDAEEQRARDVARQRIKIRPGEDPRRALSRLAGQLARRGYSPRTCFDAAREALANVPGGVPSSVTDEISEQILM